jgi:hypothetical protein
MKDGSRRRHLGMGPEKFDAARGEKGEDDGEMFCPG